MPTVWGTVVCFLLSSLKKHSLIVTYADDTSSSIRAKLLALLIKMLEEYAQNILEYMASNGLVTIPSKTGLILLNVKSEIPIEINIGSIKIVQQMIDMRT